MKALITILFLFLILNTQAQNYNCFQSSNKGYFMNGNNYVRGIRIDSVKSAGSDSVFYPYRTQRISYYLSTSLGTGFQIDTLGASWLGKNVIKHSDGTFIFDNFWDTVFIKTQAHTGDTWTFFNDTTRFSYKAIVVAEDTMTVLGVVDSIKKINIIADSGSIINTNDPVNNFQIILSKNHGFVQVFDLFTFPYHYPGFVGLDSTGFISHTIRFYDYYLDLLLDNLGTCDLGCFHDNLPDTINSIFHLFDFHNPTYNEIYNFSAGDIYESWMTIYGSTSDYELYVLDSVQSSGISATGPWHSGSENQMSLTLRWTGGYPIIFDTLYNNSTFGGGGDTNLLVDPMHMPEEWNTSYLLRFLPNYNFGILSCYSADSYEIIQDFKGTGFGYNGIAYLPSSRSITYSKGLGISRKAGYNAISFLSESQGYIYILKDTTTCGSYVNVHMLPAGISLINADNSVLISPNPASDHIDIIPVRFINTPVSVYVYDMSGRTVFCALESLSKNITINSSLWDNGMYIVTLTDDKGTITRKKIVVMK